MDSIFHPICLSYGLSDELCMSIEMFGDVLLGLNFSHVFFASFCVKTDIVLP